MKKTVTSPTATLVLAAALSGLSGAIVSAQTQAAPAAPPIASILGQVESVDVPSKALMLKGEDGGVITVTLGEKGTVVKVAPGEKSLQNAASISFDAIATGDRVLVRGGVKSEGKLDGVLRIVVMAKTDLSARNEEDQKAWRDRGIAGSVTAVDPTKAEFTLHISGMVLAPGAAGPGPAASATGGVVVDASKATLHRYADTSIKFDDAKVANVRDVSVGDQVRLLGKRSEDGSRIAADRIVFGSFKTMALSIEKIDPATGVLSVKDLETNKKFNVSVIAGGSIKKIPTEMAAMFAMMNGGRAAGAGGARPGGAPGAAAPAGDVGSRNAGGGPGGGRPGGGRGMGDMVERLPVITLADLKKDDWIGAVVGKIDAQGNAVAFNMLAGIEVFAARANRGGGVDVGMPAGLMDGAFGVPGGGL